MAPRSMRAVSEMQTGRPLVWCVNSPWSHTSPAAVPLGSPHDYIIYSTAAYTRVSVSPILFVDCLKVLSVYTCSPAEGPSRRPKIPLMLLSVTRQHSVTRQQLMQ